MYKYTLIILALAIFPSTAYSDSLINPVENSRQNMEDNRNEWYQQKGMGNIQVNPPAQRGFTPAQPQQNDNYTGRPRTKSIYQGGVGNQGMTRNGQSVR